MSGIDWSKAPPHATHWCPGNARIEPGWIYNPGGNKGEFHSCYADKGLEHIPAFPEWRKARLVPRPVEPGWNGEGLPPVGTLVEASFACEDFEKWHDGVCVAVGEDPEGRENFCVVQCGKKIAMYRDEAKRVRPRRTPEQIAAELRKAEITAMADDIAAYADHSDPGEKHFRLATFLIDNGYRKQEAS
ncbi:hypothetical protein D3C81_834320 [compost metagenome]